MIKAIIFDFFDVIRTDGFNRWLKKYGYNIEGKFAKASERMDKGEIGTDTFFELLSEASGQPASSIQQEMDSDTFLIDGIVDTLRDLQGHYKLALLSNSASDYLRAEIAKYDLERYFHLIVISSEIGMAKPQPEIFGYILDNLKLKASEVIFIDDNPKHINGAKLAGIEGIVFTDAKALRGELNDYLSR